MPAGSQELYGKVFGNPAAKPLIFLHGGPGFNSANFEGTTAQKLADTGFYVIVYDRRGEGRSADEHAAYTFSQTFADLDTIYARLNLKQATLIGHSFGGVIATLYAERNPRKVSAVVLVGAPVSLQETLKTIIRTSKEIYRQKGDSANLKYMAMLEKMDTASLQYSSLAFRQAMQNGFYSPKKPSAESRAAYARLFKDSLLKKQATSMSYAAPQGFYKNEHYTTIEMKPALQRVVAAGVRVYGLYGQEDGLYSPQQIDALRKIIGSRNLRYFEDCSHNVFVDQQAKFIGALRRWVK
jgi:proline iminopeptidase